MITGFIGIPEIEIENTMAHGRLGCRRIAAIRSSPSSDPKIQQRQATEIDRIKVGQAAPDFGLENVEASHQLSDFRGKKAVVLVFLRGYGDPSAWNSSEAEKPFDQAQKDKVQILAVSVDTGRNRKNSASCCASASTAIDFPLLEQDHKVIDRYGIFNPDGKGWPYPSTFVSIPRCGALALHRKDPRQRPSISRSSPN